MRWPRHLRRTTAASLIILARSFALASTARLASIVCSDCLIVERMLEVASRMGPIVARLKSSIMVACENWDGGVNGASGSSISSSG
jgi:hypothetical protein